MCPQAHDWPLRVNCRSRGDESAYKPDSVSTEVEGDHPSRTAVADSLMRPTCEHRAGRSFAQALRPSWSCSRRGLPSRHGHPWRWWSLTPPCHPCQDCSWRSVLCGTVPRVTPGGRYPPPCPVEPGLSSTLTWPTPRSPGRLVRRAPRVPPGSLPLLWLSV